MRPAIRSDFPILYLYYNKNFLICQGKETADGRLSEIIGLDRCGPPKITTTHKSLLTTCYSILATPKIATHYYKNHYCRYYSKSKSCYYQYTQKSLQEFLLLLYNYYLLMLLLLISIFLLLSLLFLLSISLFLLLLFTFTSI